MTSSPAALRGTLACALALAGCTTSADPTAEPTQGELYAAAEDGSSVCPEPVWSTPYPAIAGDEARTLALALDDQCLSVRATFTDQQPHDAILIDADADPNTGLHYNGWGSHDGADYLVQDNQVIAYQETGDGAWHWWLAEGVAIEPAIRTANSVEIRIPRAAFKRVALGNRFWAGHVLIGANWQPTSEIPLRSMAPYPKPQDWSPWPAVDLKLDRSMCKVDRPSPSKISRGGAATPNSGAIVPAYVPFVGVDPARFAQLAADTASWWPPTGSGKTWRASSADGSMLSQGDEVAWLRVAHAADVMNAKQRDFWVVVNGPDNGPFPEDSEVWATAAPVWDVLRQKNARIFGYVHTGVHPTADGKPAVRDFIPIEDVKAHIDRWVAKYNALDGIWLDEFYPQFESFPPTPEQRLGLPDDRLGKRCVANPRRTDLDPPAFLDAFPCDAPLDRDFCPAGLYNPDRLINPEGGYFHELTSWFRAKYPGLKLIGNAGGHLVSNHKHYAKLVDVLISYEQSWQRRIDYPHEFARLDLTGLPELPRVPNGIPHEAALFHGTPVANLPAALADAKAAGYSHVYVTHEPFGANVWGVLSDYLEAEIEALH